MGCGNCGTGANGKPAGCQSNGGCSSGGCNRLNVFDWLGNMPLFDSAKPYNIIEVSFNKGSRKEFFRNNTHMLLDKGQMIVVEGVNGFDVGMVNLTGELVKLQMKKYSVKDDMNIKRVLRLAGEDEMAVYQSQKNRENEVMVRSRAIAKQIGLEMKICEVELQADGKKGTFYYTADARVDFRELIKTYAGEFKIKVEMKQIGARQESAKVGGIGSCGRELCCSTWLTDFKSVNTTAARYQNLSINQTKLSGQCGRLKCCLNYELDTYMDALRGFPENADVIETTKGLAFLQKKDIFKNLMWYSFKESSKQYPLSIVRVREIQKMNKEGKKPDELQPEELETSAQKKAVKLEAGFVNDVGQITLKALEKSNHKKKGKPADKKPNKEAAQSPNGPRPQNTGNRPPQAPSPNRTPQGANPNRPQQSKAPGKTSQPPQQASQNRPSQRPAPKPNPPKGNAPQKRSPERKPPKPETPGTEQ
ncbi:MAG TPA: regulatory iron-sulfur-containing complex subunit RicT [Flavipsychrobacter sp.]|nr:regulatory iron-sulfur-containing complex subunit RicT [Flavipsychrobacter sp.]